MVDQQAFMLSASELFYVSALLFLAMIPLVWVTKPKRAGAGNADAAAAAH
jgi:DHA2 family multidrug resistance protein